MMSSSDESELLLEGVGEGGRGMFEVGLGEGVVSVIELSGVGGKAGVVGVGG